MIIDRFHMLRPALLTAAGLLALCMGGCQYVGAILSKVSDSKVAAEYTPTREDMMILVEDSHNPDLLGTLGDRVMTGVAEDLTKNKINQLIDPHKVIEFAADDREGFHKMSIVGLAHKFKARQILYADVTSFNVTAPIGSETAKGTLTARVKIIDAQTGETRWPQDAGWRTVTVESPTLQLKAGGSLEPLNDYIVDRLSRNISELFYEHPELNGGSAEKTDEY
jgi:hypothetical protein